jgi:two-component system, chemotaxis family, protein-glutamate methylesterase/glutaminase
MSRISSVEEAGRQELLMPDKILKVLVVDDSAYVRKVISEILNRSVYLEVVGTARDGLDALRQVKELEPDVITLDLNMPVMDGVAFLREQMSRQRIPVVVCSVADEDGGQVMAAMEAGAVEFVQKPTSLAIDKVYEIDNDLTQKVLLAGSIPPQRIPIREPVDLFPVGISPSPSGRIRAIVIGISTGGPLALRYLLPRFPVDFPLPIAIVLHMPVGYTGPYALRLNEVTKIEVLEAAEGLEMKSGRAILAQAGLHLLLRKNESGEVYVHLSSEPSDSLHRPSVDVLFQSAAEAYREGLLGVVMTGMGSDGTQGAAWIHAQGGKVITEAESSSVVYGMPQSVVEAGLSDLSVPLDRLAETIMEFLL